MRPSGELRAHESAGTPAGIDLEHLCVGELLVIWALRMRLARGPSALSRAFAWPSGLRASRRRSRASRASSASCSAIAASDIGVHAPSCRCVSADEITVAGVIAALQAGAVLHAQLMAARLVDAAVLEGFLDHADNLAVRLKAERLQLPVRSLAGCGGPPLALH